MRIIRIELPHEPEQPQHDGDKRGQDQAENPDHRVRH